MATKVRRNEHVPPIKVSKLSFTYVKTTPSGKAQTQEVPLFNDVSFEVPDNSTMLLLGANGVGKTTLLRILAGKHLVGEQTIRILGKDPFAGGLGPEDVKFVGGRFGLELDLKVSELLAQTPKKVSGTKHQKELLELLAIDPAWRMHQVSTGQRRRVDLLLSLLQLPKILLLDEITSDLDVLGRQVLLGWLREQTKQQKMTIIFATHILDGMERWASHVMFLKPGGLRCLHSFAEMQTIATQEGIEVGTKNVLLALSEKWFREDLKFSGQPR